MRHPPWACILLSSAQLSPLCGPRKRVSRQLWVGGRAAVFQAPTDPFSTVWELGSQENRWIAAKRSNTHGSLTSFLPGWHQGSGPAGSESPLLPGGQRGQVSCCFYQPPTIFLATCLFDHCQWVVTAGLEGFLCPLPQEAGLGVCPAVLTFDASTMLQALWERHQQPEE